MHTPLPPDFALQFKTLLGATGRQALTNPTPQAFTQWFERTAPKLMPALLSQLAPGAAQRDRFLRFAALKLFADLPLPGHGLRATAQVKQGRNEPCACGSGQKFKHCCGDMNMPPLFGQLNLLRYVLDAYPKTRLGEVCPSHAAIEAVADTAIQWLEEGQAERVCALLEPYFAANAPLTARLSHLFDLLMDAWLRMGRNTKRNQLVDDILQRGDRQLKCDALQRLTTMLADRGDYVGAWSNFKQASELNPNDPALSFLEVTTLMSQGRIGEAKLRAQWWAAFLSKQRDPQLTGLVERLRDLAQDPHAAMLDVATSANVDLQRLHELFLAAPAPSLRHRFEVFTQEDEDFGVRATASEFAPDAALAKLEKRWRKVFPQAKPDLTAVQNHAAEVWDNAPEWLDLLQEHPDLWLSFDVLDDLVMAVDTVAWAGVAERLLTPMAERAAEQLRVTLESKASTAVRCPWGVWSNRPILRPIAHLAFLCKDAGNWQRFMELAHWLVFELNPNDNHGLRDELSCAYVRFERWADVLALYQRYPDDMQPAMSLNAALAALALGDKDQARQRIVQAQQDHPALLKMLLQATAPKPVKPESYGITVGGKYEAWLYVSQMREFWARHNALDWARAALKPGKGAPKLPPAGQQSLL